MAIQKRSLVMVVLLALASLAYGVGRHYSPALVRYVVEQSLIQKAPAGVNSILVHERLYTLLTAIPDKNARMQRLFRISEYLEKVQRLTYKEWDGLMSGGESRNSPAL